MARAKEERQTTVSTADTLGHRFGIKTAMREDIDEEFMSSWRNGRYEIPWAGFKKPGVGGVVKFLTSGGSPRWPSTHEV